MIASCTSEKKKRPPLEVAVSVKNRFCRTDIANRYHLPTAAEYAKRSHGQPDEGEGGGLGDDSVGADQSLLSPADRCARTAPPSVETELNRIATNESRDTCQIDFDKIQEATGALGQ